jgi:hypothetical protein
MRIPPKLLDLLSMVAIAIATGLVVYGGLYLWDTGPAGKLVMAGAAAVAGLGGVASARRDGWKYENLFVFVWLLLLAVSWTAAAMGNEMLRRAALWPTLPLTLIMIFRVVKQRRLERQAGESA